LSKSLHEFDPDFDSRINGRVQEFQEAGTGVAGVQELQELQNGERRGDSGGARRIRSREGAGFCVIFADQNKSATSKTPELLQLLNSLILVRYCSFRYALDWVFS
jgi:hypothetical protein